MHFQIGYMKRPGVNMIKKWEIGSIVTAGGDVYKEREFLVILKLGKNEYLAVLAESILRAKNVYLIKKGKE